MKGGVGVDGCANEKLTDALEELYGLMLAFHSIELVFRAYTCLDRYTRVYTSTIRLLPKCFPDFFL